MIFITGVVVFTPNLVYVLSQEDSDGAQRKKLTRALEGLPSDGSQSPLRLLLGRVGALIWHDIQQGIPRPLLYKDFPL